VAMGSAPDLSITDSEVVGREPPFWQKKREFEKTKISDDFNTFKSVTLTGKTPSVSLNHGGL